MYVCINTLTFESLDVGSSFSHIRYFSMVYRSRSWVTGAKVVENPYPQCKTSIGNNCGSIKHRAMNFACSKEFLTMPNWMVWPPSLSR